MASRFNSTFSVSFIKFILILMFPLLLGVEACSEPSEYCRVAYESKKDRKECTLFCDNEYRGKNDARDACRIGQQAFLLQGATARVEDAVAICDREFKNSKDLANACITGSSTEGWRSANKSKSPGSATDRETGN